MGVFNTALGKTYKVGNHLSHFNVDQCNKKKKSAPEMT